MKIGFIIVGTEKTKDDVARLKNQLKRFKSRQISIYEIVNREGVEGYAKGVNKGIRKGLKDKIDVFFALNPDISLPNISLSRLLQVIEHFHIWGYRMKQQGVLYDGGVIDSRRLSGHLKQVKSKKRYIPADFISGSLMGFTKGVVERIGMWDESFGMYYEDVEYCTLARKKGLQVGIDTSITYTHFERSSYSVKKDAQLAKSRARYFLHNANILQYLLETIRIPKTLYEYRVLVWRGIVSRPFLSNFLSLNTSSLINKGLNFILFLLLIRLLSTDDYGRYNIVWVHIGLLMPLADFGTTSYGILHKDITNKKVFSSLFWFRLILSALFTTITVGLSFMFGFSKYIVYLIFLCIPVMLSNAVSGSVLIRLSSLKKSYIAAMTSVLFNVILITSLIISTYLLKSLTFVFVLVSLLYTLYFFLNLYILYIYQSFEWRRVDVQWKNIAKGSSLFVLLGFFAGLYFKADVYLLSKLKGDSVVGIYSAGYKFLEALLFIGSSYTIAATPILQQFVHKKKGEEFVNKIRRDSKLLFTLSSIFIIALGIFADRVLFTVFTNDYLASITVFKIVIIALPFLLVSTVYMNGLYLLQKVRWVIYVFVLQIIFNISLNLWLIPRYSYIASSWITVASEVLNAVLVFSLFQYAYEHRG